MTNQTIIYIPGCMSFDSHQDFLDDLLKYTFTPNPPSRGLGAWLHATFSSTHQVLLPSMPDKRNAHFDAWSIWFEKVLDYCKHDDLTLVGQSRGATFILKWLHENNRAVNIKQLHLVSPPFNSATVGRTLASFNIDELHPERIQAKASNIFIYHSKDDQEITYANAEAWHRALPNARLHTYDHRGHFDQPSLDELAEHIRNAP